MLREEFQSIPMSAREVRKFGVTIGAVLVFGAIFLYWKGTPSAIHFALAGVVFAAMTWLVPALMRPFYRGWMAFAVVMGFVMTRVILAVLFYGLFTPISLVMKLLRKDPLHERVDEQAESYWVKREGRVYEPQSSERMF